MSILYDENDTPLEAFTKEEIASSDEFVEAQEYLALRESLEEKDKLIAELQIKTGSVTENFSGLRKKVEATEKEKVDLEEKMKEVEGKADEAFKMMKENSLDVLVGRYTRDVEVAKKVKHWYSTFSGEPQDEKEKEQRIKNALLLATAGESHSDVLGDSVVSNAGGHYKATEESVAKGRLSNDNAIAVARALGLSDEELKSSKLI